MKLLVILSEDGEIFQVRSKEKVEGIQFVDLSDLTDENIYDLRNEYPHNIGE